MEVDSWNKRFQGAKKIKLAKAMVAFNANIDAVVLGLEQANKVFLDFTKEELAHIEKKSDHEVHEIKNHVDFATALAHCVKTGKAMHVPATKDVVDSFEKVFTPSEKRMGGQAGIIANQLAAFQDFVLAYTSFLSPKQASYFDSNVCFPTIKGKKLVCNSAKAVARKEDPTKINWIFEFKAGEKLKVVSEFQAPRANRLIVSSEIHYSPVFENVDLKQLAKHADVAFLAGFQQLHKQKDLPQILKTIDSQVKELEKANKKLAVHWEFVSMDDKNAEKQVLLSLGKTVHSFGLNEVEIVDVLNLLGAKKEADRIEKAENAYTLYVGCKKILDTLEIQRVHLHSFGFQLLVLKNPYPIEVEKARDCLVVSSAVAALKALKGSAYVTKNDLKTHVLAPSSTGFNQLRALEGGIDEQRVKRHSSFERRALLESGIFDLKDHYVIIVPAPIVQPKSTVGLGDIISSVALACERA